MASHKEKLSFHDSAETIMALCQAAVRSMGLRTVTQERNRLVVREVSQQGQHLQVQIPVQLEIKVLPLSSGCGLELMASNVGFGAAQTQRVQAMVTAFARQIDFEMDRPNMQRQQEEEELAKLAEKRRKREMEEQAEAEEAAQRARARALVMQQLSGKPAAPPSENAEGAEEGEAEPLPEPTIDDLAAMLLPHSAPAASRNVSPTAAQPMLQPVAPAVSQDDFVANLERLANLHKIGALSDDEFKAAKNRLLGL